MGSERQQNAKDTPQKIERWVVHISQLRGFIRRPEEDGGQDIAILPEVFNPDRSQK